VSEPVVLDASGVADVGAFLARALRLDPSVLVRLRDGSVWSQLPFGVLVTRPAPITVVDATVRAADLLAALDSLPATQGLARLPARHDSAWRWPLPTGPARPVEALPAEVVGRVSAAAAETVRAAERDGVGGRAVGSRALRDALLDHVPIVITTRDGERVAVPQRLVQGVARMGFLHAGDGASDRESDRVMVRVTGEWVGLSSPYGTAWYRPGGGALSLRPRA
jgi:hypothetical protein